MVAVSLKRSTDAKYGKSESNEYIIHAQTRNSSFLKIFDYLKKRNVTNNKFFLRLYDPDLAKIDPFSNRLTDVQKNKIIAEITKNPYYYLREIVRIKTPIGPVPFELHPGNLAITWAIFNRLDFIVLLPRQRYKTVSIAAVLAWIYDFGTKNTHMLFGNKALNDSKNNLKRLKDIRDGYPEYLKEAVLNKKDIDNLESIISHSRNNKITLSGQPTNEIEADKQGKCTLLCINTINCLKALFTIW